MDRIPNARWLGLGAAMTVGAMLKVPFNAYVSAYMVVGVAVACAFMIFNNPESGPARFDISLCVAFLSFMWPVILFTMLLTRPWNEPKWKNRNRQGEQRGAVAGPAVGTLRGGSDSEVEGGQREARP